MQDQYKNLLSQFVTDNLSIFQANRRYSEIKEGREDTSLNYLPNHNEKADDNFIGNTPQFKELLNTFMSSFIERDDIVFNLQGHFPQFDGRTMTEVMKTVSFHDRANLIETCAFDMKLLIDLFNLFLSLSGNEKYHSFMFSYGKNRIELHSTQACPSCSTYITMVIDYNTNTVCSLLKKPDCLLKEQPDTIEIDLESPSGKLVFLNDPRRFLKVERDERNSRSINSLLGCIEETKAYAAHNVGFFFIANSLPNIMQDHEKILFTSYNDEDEESIEKFKDYANLGYVCADLWWYTVLDHQLYLDLCAAKGVDPESIDHTVAVTDRPTFKVVHDLTAHKVGHHFGVFSTITY